MRSVNGCFTSTCKSWMTITKLHVWRPSRSEAVGEPFRRRLPKRKAAGDLRFPWNGSGEFTVVDLAMMQTWQKKTEGKVPFILSVITWQHNLYSYICDKKTCILFAYDILWHLEGRHSVPPSVLRPKQHNEQMCTFWTMSVCTELLQTLGTRRIHLNQVIPASCQP